MDTATQEHIDAVLGELDATLRELFEHPLVVWTMDRNGIEVATYFEDVRLTAQTHIAVAAHKLNLLDAMGGTHV